MSWRAYPILATSPDFSNASESGLGEGGSTIVEFGQASPWIGWHGSTGLALGFTWRFDSPAEQRNLRQFVNQAAGRARPFFLPSWTADFILTAAASIGDTAIRIAAAGLADITENRPGTEGRQLFLVSTDGAFQGVGVIEATLDGDEEVLALDAPLLAEFAVGRSVVGKLHLVRLASDQIEFQQDLPGHGSVELRAVTSRVTRHVTEIVDIDGAAIFGLRPFVDVIATDADPEYFIFHFPDAMGPFSYGVAGSSNYQVPWIGSVEGIEVVLTSGLGEVVTSGLFDGSIPPSFWTFDFDASGSEFVAWEKGEGIIRLGYFNAGIESFRDFPGRTPVGFNTYRIDSTSTPATADAVLFYLRDGFSCIFARFGRENFATEHVACQTPIAPLALHKARANGAKIEVVGMDAGHRLTVWRAGDYVPPIPAEVIGSYLAGPVGDYRPVAMVVALDESASSTLAAVIGEYESIRQTAETTEASKSAIGSSMAGAYVLASIPATATESGASGTLAISLPGAYLLVRKETAADEASSSSINPIIGTYAP